MSVNDLYTDLAVEKTITSESEIIPGIETKTVFQGIIKVTEIRIITDEASEKIGKPCGKYVSVEGFDIDNADELGKILSNVITSFWTKTPKNVLVCGLGNRNITPDSLGSETADKIKVTRVIADVAGIDVRTEVSSVAPGVLGATGIETAEILQGICDKINPDLVIVIDSLCARDIHRISSVVQITDTGIQPGGGLKNYRNGINSQTLKRQVLSIGIPTVVYAKTICHNVMEMLLRGQTSCDEESIDGVIEKLGDTVLSELVVTPKDIDEQIEKLSSALANGINFALETDDLY